MGGSELFAQEQILALFISLVEIEIQPLHAATARQIDRWMKWCKHFDCHRPRLAKFMCSGILAQNDGRFFKAREKSRKDSFFEIATRVQQKCQLCIGFLTVCDPFAKCSRSFGIPLTKEFQSFFRYIYSKAASFIHICSIILRTKQQILKESRFHITQTLNYLPHT